MKTADWSEIPFGSQASYCNIRLSKDALEEHDEGRTLVRIALRTAPHMKLCYGQSAERPTAQTLFGAALSCIGAFGVIAQLKLWFTNGRIIPLLSAGAACILVVGVWMLAQLARKRWFLLLMTMPRRKLVFDSCASEPGLSIFVSALQRNESTHIELPEGFFEASRYCGRPTESPETLVEVRRPIDATSQSSLTSVSFKMRAGLEFLVDSLANWLQQYIEDGALIRDRDTLSYGVFPLLAEVTEGHMTLLAPTSDPTRWQEDLSSVLLTTARQRFIAESFTPDPDFEPPDFRARISFSINAVEGPVLMSRSELDHTVPQHSGWFVWSVAENSKNAEEGEMVQLTVIEFLTIRPDLAEYLALPARYKVGFVGETPRLLLDENELDAQEGTYYHAKLHGLELPAEWQGTA